MSDMSDGDPYELFDPSPIPPAAAASAIGRHRGQRENFAKQAESIQQQQQDAVARATAILDETTAALKARRADPSRSNLPLLALGAGMMGPGNFGTQVGRGVQMMIPQIMAQRATDDADDRQYAELAIKKAGLESAPLAQRLAYLRAMETGELNAERALETAQIRAQGRAAAGGADPALVKEWRVWQEQPENRGKPLSEYMEWKSLLGSDRNTPAILREFREWEKRPENAGKPIEEYMRVKAGAGASGKETGKAQGEAAAGLPTFEANYKHLNDTIEKMVKHPGIENAVGTLWAKTPPIPGTLKADFLALEESLLGQTFLDAYNSLRGGGAITEAEGLKATAARVAASRTQSKDAYIANLREYQKRLEEGREIMRAKARNPNAPAPTTTSSGASVPSGLESPTATPNEIPDGTTATNPKTKQRMIRRAGKWEPLNE